MRVAAPLCAAVALLAAACLPKGETPVKDSAAPKTEHVRGELIYGSYVLTSVDDGRRTRVVAEVLCDPKGAVARWMVNLVQKSWPFETIANLRRQVENPGLADNPELFSLLAQEGVLRVSPSRGR